MINLGTSHYCQSTHLMSWFAVTNILVLFKLVICTVRKYCSYYSLKWERELSSWHLELTFEICAILTFKNCVFDMWELWFWHFRTVILTFENCYFDFWWHLRTLNLTVIITFENCHDLIWELEKLNSILILNYCNSFRCPSYFIPCVV